MMNNDSQVPPNRPKVKRKSGLARKRTGLVARTRRPCCMDAVILMDPLVL